MLQLDVPFRGGNIWVAVHGEHRARTPLLCIPGGPGLPHDYLEPLLALADERPVVVYDQIGCGRSTRLSLPWSRELLMDELATVRDALAMPRVHAFMHSGAGLYGIEEVLRRPQLYAGLVLESVPVDMPAFLRSLESQIDQLPAELARALRDGEHDPRKRGLPYAQAYYEYARRFVINVVPPPPAMVRGGQGFNLASLAAVKGGMVIHTGPCRTWSVEQRLGELPMPVLVCVGKDDPVTPAMAEAIARAVPNGRHVVFERSSHMPHWEQQHELIATVREFLRSID